jgi:hypothetical protein
MLPNLGQREQDGPLDVDSQNLDHEYAPGSPSSSERETDPVVDERGERRKRGSVSWPLTYSFLESEGTDGYRGESDVRQIRKGIVACPTSEGYEGNVHQR